jgi:Tfp pilus assembly protein PilN
MAARRSDARQASKSTGQRSHIGMAGVAFLIGAAGIVLAALVAESSMTAEQHIMLLE